MGRALRPPGPPRTPLVLFAVALAWHGYWASTVPVPSDWDPAYYLEVARHLAAGEGAVTDAVWNLGWLPPALRHAADLHWMPLPSRVLVPFVALAADDWPAAKLCAVILASAWAPLAWAWARRLDAGPAEAASAGLLAVTAGGYVRTVTTPDSIALYGLLGGALLLTASRRSPLAIPLAALVSLTRGDGFLLAAACALAWPGLGGWRVMAAGVGATALWYARCYALAGEGWLAMRARVASSLTLQQVLAPVDPPFATLGDRLGFLGGELGTIVVVGLVVGLGAMPFFAAAALWRARADPGLRPLPVYVLGFPVVIHLLAPAIAAEGSVYRSGAALFVPLCALASMGASRLTSRYHPAFLPGLLVVATVVAAVVTGRQYQRVLAQLGDDCRLLTAVPPGVPVMSYDPVGVAARCGRPGVVMVRGQPLDALVDRYDVDWALAAPADYDNGTVRAVDWPLAGWSQVDERLFRRR